MDDLPLLPFRWLRLSSDSINLTILLCWCKKISIQWPVDIICIDGRSDRSSPPKFSSDCPIVRRYDIELHHNIVAFQHESKYYPLVRSHGRDPRNRSNWCEPPDCQSQWFASSGVWFGGHGRDFSSFRRRMDSCRARSDNHKSTFPAVGHFYALVQINVISIQVADQNKRRAE